MQIVDYDKEKGWHYRPVKEREMPFMKWEKTSDGYKPIEITDEEMFAENARRRGKRAEVWLDEANEMGSERRRRKWNLTKAEYTQQ